MEDVAYVRSLKELVYRETPAARFIVMELSLICCLVVIKTSPHRPCLTSLYRYATLPPPYAAI